jgi:hypothetical protein
MCENKGDIAERLTIRSPLTVGSIILYLHAVTALKAEERPFLVKCAIEHILNSFSAILGKTKRYTAATVITLLSLCSHAQK